jgi:hypothetical protein
MAEAGLRSDLTRPQTNLSSDSTRRTASKKDQNSHNCFWLPQSMASHNCRHGRDLCRSRLSKPGNGGFEVVQSRTVSSDDVKAESHQSPGKLKRATSTTFGLITSANPMRKLQFGLRLTF